MTWINVNGQQQIDRPTRVRLSDGFTRTNEEVTDDMLLASGWSWEANEAIQGITTSTQVDEVL